MIIRRVLVLALCAGCVAPLAPERSTLRPDLLTSTVAGAITPCGRIVPDSLVIDDARYRLELLTCRTGR